MNVVFPSGPPLDALEVGDSCFAHVKGYPWWPAKVTEKIQSGNKKYSVTFFGTYETAFLPSHEVKSISPETIKKLASPAAMRRKNFQHGFREMMKQASKEHILAAHTSSILGDISNRVGVMKEKSSVSVEMVKVAESCQGRSGFVNKLTEALEAKTDEFEIIVKILFLIYIM